MSSFTEGAFKPGRYAAIDIGTVTCRLFVADVNSEGAISKVAYDLNITNLGEGVDETNRLTPQAIERVGSTIDRFAQHIAACESDSCPVSVMAVATSAARDAENSDELLDRLAQAGVTLSIVPGEREAALSFMGATSAFPGEKAVVIDVGGGSTEIIAGTAGAPPVRAHSFQIGCRRVTERFFKEDPPASESLYQAATWIAGEMQEYLTELCGADLLDGRVIAVAGTATSVVSMREEMVVYDSDAVHGATVTRADIDALLERLSALPLAERERVIGLEPRRAPVIVAGILILQQIMETAGVDELTISESDILQGIILASASC